MGAGTFSFDRWLACLEAALSTQAPRLKWQILTAEAYEAFGAVIWFANIFGRRWSYFAGKASGAFAADVLQKIPLAPDFGLVCATWGTMSLRQRAAFVEWIKKQMHSGPCEASP